MKAWRVTWKGIVSIVVGVNSSAVRGKMVRHAKDVGYQPRFFDVRAVRAPEYDAWAATTRYGCVDEEFVKRQIEAKDAKE